MAHEVSPGPPHIGTLSERSLHAAIKQALMQPGDQAEVRVGRRIVDILRQGENGNLLIEIQTRHFYAIRPKLEGLLADNHRLHLVHPIAQRRWIVKLARDGQSLIERRKSPKVGYLEDIFIELVGIPYLVGHPGFTLEILLIEEEEVRIDDGKGSWRRGKWSISDHRLLTINERRVIAGPRDLLSLLPPELPQPFTNAELARRLGRSPALASKITYCLRAMGLAEAAGRHGRSKLFVLVGQSEDRAPA